MANPNQLFFCQSTCESPGNGDFRTPGIAMTAYLLRVSSHVSGAFRILWWLCCCQKSCMAPCTPQSSNLLRHTPRITFFCSFTNFCLTGKENILHGVVFDQAMLQQTRSTGTKAWSSCTVVQQLMHWQSLCALPGQGDVSLFGESSVGMLTAYKTSWPWVEVCSCLRQKSAMCIKTDRSICLHSIWKPR